MNSVVAYMRDWAFNRELPTRIVADKKGIVRRYPAKFHQAPVTQDKLAATDVALVPAHNAAADERINELEQVVSEVLVHCPGKNDLPDNLPQRLQEALHKTPETVKAEMASSTYTHIDDWLDDTWAAFNASPEEKYARWWFEQHRWSPSKMAIYEPIMRQHQLYVTYGGVRWRVTGASRMGDVFIIKDFAKDSGYDLRVSLNQCLDWGKAP